MCVIIGRIDLDHINIFICSNKQQTERRIKWEKSGNKTELINTVDQLKYIISQCDCERWCLLKCILHSFCRSENSLKQIEELVWKGLIVMDRPTRKTRSTVTETAIRFGSVYTTTSCVGDTFSTQINVSPNSVNVIADANGLRGYQQRESRS